MQKTSKKNSQREAATVSSWDRLPFPWSDFNPCSPKSLHSILGNLDAAPRKRWGQNFLIDQAAQQRIVAAANIGQDDRVWEIGPGMGALTQYLWRSCHSLTLFEIDPVLLKFYASRLQLPSQVAANTVENLRNGCCQLVAGDVIATWKQTYLEQDRCPDVVISNLPYNSASLIMSEFAQQAEFRPHTMVFTVQKEMAERLNAKERSKPYSSFSVLMQCQFHIENLFGLTPQLFYPKPNVLSATLRFQPREHALSPSQVGKLERFTRAIFSHRRKTIANNIKASNFKADYSELTAKLREIGIECSQRAEEISIAQFLALGTLF